MYALANSYEVGDGIVVSFEQAAELYRTGAKKGHMGCQYNLGVLLRTGRGISGGSL